MTPTVRQRLLFGLLAASAAAVAWDRLRAAPPSGIAESVARPVATDSPSTAPATLTSGPPVVSASSAAAAATTAITIAGTRATRVASNGLLALRDRTGYDAAGGDAFPSLAPPPPPAPPPVAAAVVEAPRPTAPALPFTVIGKKQDAGRWEVYLARGDQTLVATVGAALGGEYRVTAITPSQMTLIYLPLQETQRLPIGAAFDD